MDADVMIKANDRLNCFLHCDRSSMKETLSPYGQQRVILCPKGRDVDRLECSIKQVVKEYCFRVYPVKKALNIFTG